MKEKIDIPAIHDDDFEKLLQKLDLLDDFNSGKTCCYYCNAKINHYNVYGVLYVNDSMTFICDSTVCFEIHSQI